jgi:hypothetical protein
MKARVVSLIGGAVLSCLLLAGCGGNHGVTVPAPPAAPTPPPAPPMTMNLDTAAVLAIVVVKTSETAEPFQVDNGAVAVIPIGDETSAPISVDAT